MLLRLCRILLFSAKSYLNVEQCLKDLSLKSKDVWKNFLTEPEEREIYERIKSVR